MIYLHVCLFIILFIYLFILLRQSIGYSAGVHLLMTSVVTWKLLSSELDNPLRRFRFHFLKIKTNANKCEVHISSLTMAQSALTPS